MRFISDIGLFLSGLAFALLSVSAVRSFGDPWGWVQLPVIIIAAAVFFMKDSRLASLTAGLGLGLDALSAYPFFTWTMILSITALSGLWLSKTVLTNRSLPSLVLLGAVMHAVYFVFELVFSRASQLFGGSVWYRLRGADLPRNFIAFAIEMAILAIIFIIYVRSRGERSRMLTHL